MQNHGLHKYLTLSTRVAAKLTHASGTNLIFIGVFDKERTDNRVNSNRMFRTLETGMPPYFAELDGPWTKYNDVMSATVGDVNGDGLQDLITCGRNGGRPHIYVQKENGAFYEVRIPPEMYGFGRQRTSWRNVEIGYVTGRHRPDLVTVEGYGTDPAYLRIYRGIAEAPFFDFDGKPYFERMLPYAAPGVSIVDVNGDGYKDIYVTQADETSGYCSVWGKEVSGYWSPDKPWPSSDWVPPVDEASDLLFVGGFRTERDEGEKLTFRSVPMREKLRGCGWWTWKFGNQHTLVVAEGRIIHSGYSYLLEWSPE